MGTKSKKAVAKAKRASSPAKSVAKGKQGVKRTGGAAAAKSGGAAAAEGKAREEAPRRLGIRGAAPWAARHAAKHAAEARARAAEPPPPGSARATIRTPTGAEEIKVKVALLHNAVNEIRTLKKTLSRSFYDIGLVLHDIRERKLYEARGFGNLETFLEREVDLGKMTALRLIRAVEVFQREPALEFGMERVFYVLNILEAPDKPHSAPAPAPSATQTSRPALPLRPPGRK